MPSWKKLFDAITWRIWKLKFAKSIIVHLLWLYHKIFKSGRKIIFQGKTYPYFYHPYNYTWLAERTVEIPIICEMIKPYVEADKEILEVGNVLSHYFPVCHDVLDKYERAPEVINQDVVNFKPRKKYDLIISVSTLEHVGWDEKPRKPGKVLQAVKNLKKLLTPNGKMIITLPLGYNPEVDKLLTTNRLGLRQRFYLKRISKDNLWQEVKWKDIKNAKYNYPFFTVNGLVIGIIEKRN